MQKVDYTATVPLDLSKIPFEYIEFDPKIQFSGVYACYCTSNNKFYIGSTKSFLPTRTYKGRKADHLNALKRQDHGNPIFKRAFKKYGESNFFWFKLEGEIQEEDLLSREDFYLAKYKPFDRNVGFNINEKATGGNPNFKPIISHYKFVRFSGEIVEGENLTKFARDNNIWLRYLISLKFGKRDYCQGLIDFSNIHRLEEIVSLAKRKERKKTYYKLISPTGEIVEGDDREAFCKKYGLKMRNMWDILSGRVDTVFGWRLFIPGKHPDRNLTQEELKLQDEEIKLERVKGVEVRFNGRKIKISSVKGYCRKMGLSSTSLFGVVNAERETAYKGYTHESEEIHQKQIRNSIKAIAINEKGEFVKVSHISRFCKDFGIKLTDIHYHSQRNKFINGYSFIFDTDKMNEEQERAALKDKKVKLFPNKPELGLKEVSIEALMRRGECLV